MKHYIVHNTNWTIITAPISQVSFSHQHLVSDLKQERYVSGCCSGYSMSPALITRLPVEFVSSSCWITFNYRWGAVFLHEWHLHFAWESTERHQTRLENKMSVWWLVFNTLTHMHLYLSPSPIALFALHPTFRKTCTFAKKPTFLNPYRLKNQHQNDRVGVVSVYLRLKTRRFRDLMLSWCDLPMFCCCCCNVAKQLASHNWEGCQLHHCANWTEQ